MDGLDFACIEEDERHALEREFTKEEVTQVLREIKPPVLMDSLWSSFTNVGVSWKGMLWLSLSTSTGTLFSKGL